MNNGDPKGSDSTAAGGGEANARVRSLRPQGQPIPAPLPSRRYEGRTGVWLEPESQQGEGDTPLQDYSGLPPLPRTQGRRNRSTLWSFLLAVVLPTVLLGGYYYLVAEDEYFAEFRFSVTQGNPVLPGSSSGAIGSPAGGSGLSVLLGAPGGSGAAPQNFIVTDYLTSPQVIEDLQKHIDLRSLYARPQINVFQRFDTGQPNEAFARYFKNFIHADYDQVTGLAVATVRAFTAADAKLIGQTLVELSEELVNSINTRAYRDAIRSAEAEVQTAQARMKEINIELLQFRNKEGVINPDNSVVATNIQLEQQLQNSLVNLQTQLGAQGQSNMDTQDGPAAKLLRAQIASTRQQLAAVGHQIAHNSKDSAGLAQVVGKYEELSLDQQFAQSMVLQTMQALDLARANAVAQHLYIVPYVTPVLPQSATYPKRALNTLLGGLAFFGIWLASLLTFRTIQDHAI